MVDSDLNNSKEPVDHDGHDKSDSLGGLNAPLDLSSPKEPTALERFSQVWQLLKRDPLFMGIAIGFFVWFIFACEWLWAHNVPDSLRWVIFVAAFVGAFLASVVAWLERGKMIAMIVSSICLFPVWQASVFVADFFAASSFAQTLATIGLVTIFFVGLCWTVYGVELGSTYYKKLHHAQCGYADQSSLEMMGEGNYTAKHSLAFAGAQGPEIDNRKEIWNPVDLEAWYYGDEQKKLNQSLFTILIYVLIFVLLVVLFNQLGGCQEIYEMPAGGGEETQKVQKIKIKKIIREKYVINPFSSVVFNPPPIEEVQLNIEELTKHEYEIGQGKGKGAGFSGGTFKGKVRFIRLKYDGGDWDQDMGIGGDLNLLLRYGIETGHQIAKKTEYRSVRELDNFPRGKSPPMVYMTGQRSISLSTKEVKILREYILDKHGMVFADNGGSSQFHSQFLSMMDKVLEGTGVYPVKVPLDDVIHRRPFGLPFLPYVAPHGGKDALGWYKDGRWVAYYHPGDIGDAWADGHAGVRREVYDACYKLGINVIFYAHAEYNKWLSSQKKDD